ncbi:MAG: AbrB/MazE/SpoVT family DNA-binding domain-containing protein [Thermoprotei archaeon]|nr:MAG: AbrB/MazE/SpoVT family DNA-binding domain-containing protein [Thermoprotei archaeon]
MIIEGRVGSKGELFPPKKIREKLGLKPHMKVIYRVEGGRLLVEPIPSLEDVLEEPPAVEITLEEFHRFRRELSRKAEI